MKSRQSDSTSKRSEVNRYNLNLPDNQLAGIPLDDFPNSPTSPPMSPPPRTDCFRPADSSEDELHTCNMPRRLHCLRWFITLFFEKSMDKEKMKSITNGNVAKLRKHISRAIACYDEAPLTGRKHIHLAVVFKSEVTFETLQRTFGPNNHFECITGSWNGVVAYILGPPPKECFLKINIVRPEFPKPKSPTRQLFETAVQTKDPEEAIATIEKPGNEVAVRHFKTALDFIKQTWSPSINPILRVKVYICGDPGTGKTSLAHEICKLGRRTSVFSFSPAGQLVGGYDNADVALFDDLNLSNHNIPHEFLFQLFDIYELKIDVKGTTLNYSPQLVIITRCELPTEFESSFGWKENEIKQFTRRMDFIIRIKVVGKRRAYYLIDNETLKEIGIAKGMIVLRIRNRLV